MRTTLWLGLVCMVGAAAINACGSSGGGNGTEGTGDSGTGGNATTSMSTGGSGGSASTSSSSSSTSSSTSASSSSSSSSSSSGSMMVNGCDPSTAEDHTADSSVTVTFGGAAGLKYSPACIKISKGSSVTFSGSFVSHPLTGGTDGTPDSTSPITETSTGSTATFSFPNAGTFPYYCEVHVSSGMKGAVFVQ